MNPLFQNALNRHPQAVPPIWFMRQAGRYHSHYRALREKYSFMDLCKRPELACEVTLGPIHDFDYDVAILFSDLLFPLEALGMSLSYENGPPEIAPILDYDLLNKFVPADEAAEQLLFQKEAVKLLRAALPTNKSLIGFIGGPFTLFTYALGAARSERLMEAKHNFELFQEFSKRIVPLLRKNIELQLQGGAELVMIFESTGGALSPLQYTHYCIPPLQELCRGFHNKVAYYIRESTEDHLKNVQRHILELAGIGVDHRFNLPQMLASSEKGFIQGNFDQSLLFLETTAFRRELRNYLDPFKDLTLEQRAGWVCGLGHGVLPKTPEPHIKIFIEEVRKAFSI